jgi:Flagellar biosynthesis pathway, component FlhA
VRHLELVLRKYSYELFTLEELKWLLDELHSTDPLLVEALPETLTLLELHRVIQHLMREGVPLRPLQDVLRRLLDFGKLTHDPVMLAEMVRKALTN